MTSKIVTSLAFAAGCVLALGAMPAQAQQFHQPHMNQPMMTAPMQTHVSSNAPRANPGDFGGWSARRNNIESARYDRLLQTNMGFRQARMRKECGPINDPQLRGQCLASFNQYEPVMTGSSAPPRGMAQKRMIKQRVMHHQTRSGY